MSQYIRVNFETVDSATKKELATQILTNYKKLGIIAPNQEELEEILNENNKIPEAVCEKIYDGHTNWTVDLSKVPKNVRFITFEVSY